MPVPNMGSELFFKEIVYRIVDISMGIFLNTNKEGYWVTKWSNGSIRSDGVYVNDLKEGKWTTYLPNGEKVTEMFYIHGNANGRYAKYFGDNRNIKETGFYVNGKRAGTWYLIVNGIKNLLGRYQNGRKVGIWIDYDKATGSPTWEMDYGEGREDPRMRWIGIGPRPTEDEDDE